MLKFKSNKKNRPPIQPGPVVKADNPGGAAEAPLTYKPPFLMLFRSWNPRLFFYTERQVPRIPEKSDCETVIFCNKAKSGVLGQTSALRWR